MELKPGYKQTEVGVIPEDWTKISLGDLVDAASPICYGVVQVGPHTEGGVPIVAIKYVNEIASAPLHRAANKIERPYSRSRIKPGDVLISIKGTIGRVGVVPAGFEGNISRELARLRLSRETIPEYVAHQLESSVTQNRISSAVVGTTRLEFSIATVRRFEIPIPPTIAEQEAIAGVLSDADALIESLEHLVAKKRQIKHGAMQELLTGQKRLPGFTGQWETMRIADIAIPRSDRNSRSESLPVLTCSKHLGFVDSLGYFKNQVFSRDTAGYRIIRRGEIGYPANHIEEGSIGLQVLYDVAIVSPIYVIFAVSENVSSYFLHRLLKLDTYRQQFQTATSASVDRRGSLRWPVFSQITITLPLLPEQQAIAAILSDMDAEIAALEAKLAKAREVKQGMMQELLTGRIRLV